MRNCIGHHLSIWDVIPLSLFLISIFITITAVTTTTIMIIIINTTNNCISIITSAPGFYLFPILLPTPPGGWNEQGALWYLCASCGSTMTSGTLNPWSWIVLGNLSSHFRAKQVSSCFAFSDNINRCLKIYSLKIASLTE